MQRSRSRLVRRWLAWGMLGVLVISLAMWFATRDHLPRRIVIASAHPGGLYAEFAGALAGRIEGRTGRSVEIVTSSGSQANRDLLLAGGNGPLGVEVAILQAGSVPMDGLAIVAPLYPDVVQVIARRELEIRSIAELAGRRVVVGEAGSGMQASAAELFQHYFGVGEVDRPVAVEEPFERMLVVPEIYDAAVVTTGIRNPALAALLESGRFTMVPVEDAEALALKHQHLSTFEIPRGLYCGHPTVPAEGVRTVATTAVLAVRADANERLVGDLLAALYEGGLSSRFPELIPRHEAISRKPEALHPAARAYLDPIDNLGWIPERVESLAAVRELLVACAAGVFLIWDRWRRLKEREKQDEIREQKDRLDHFLAETMTIERAQADTDDPAALRRLLDEVTRIKLDAMQEFTNEELRGNSTFSLFLLQCSNLMSTIQLRMILAVRLRESAGAAVNGNPASPSTRALNDQASAAG